MAFFDNFTIQSRLLVSFSFVLLLLGVVVGSNYRSGQNSVEQVRQLIDEEFTKYELVAAIDSATKDNARRTLNLFIVSPAERAGVKERMGIAKKEIDALFAKLEPLLVRPEGKALFAQMREKRIAFVKAFTAAQEALAAGDEPKAMALVRENVNPAIAALSEPVSKLLVLQKQIADGRAAELVKATHQANSLGIALGVLATVLGFAAAGLLIRSITGPLRVVNQVANEIAKGNLDVHIDASGKNELTDMLISMNHMQQFLSHVIMRIQESAAEVANASSEIAKANMDLSSRTESQASSLEETAAAMEEMTSTVQSNADITQTASHLTGDVSVSAEQVGGLVGSVVSTMEEINDSSRRIHDIIGVINSIAFQTNILALNAAVEAARAGEQGRGFAVVATEVRSLAQRSAQAAQEIKTIIEENVAKIATGNEVASRAGAAVTSVVQSIQKVRTSVSEVASATKEQSIGIEQVGQAVAQLDQATQQNAALVEQTAAASGNLDEQVQALKQAINRFRIGSKASSKFMALELQTP